MQAAMHADQQLTLGFVFEEDGGRIFLMHNLD